MSQTLSPAVPFAARGAMLPNLVQLAPVIPAYDPEQQLNVLADGTPWYTTPMAASSTDTNWDSQPDDTADPYFASAS
ncbi:putative ATP-grasp-modified RiPP [Streptacidiphilus sp. 4-A2]|nr:putative ATP-grasp-modified RiPP [Streptacidiphilus sp. 4-A2]